MARTQATRPGDKGTNHDGGPLCPGKFFTCVMCEMGGTICGNVAQICFCSRTSLLVYCLYSIFIDSKSSFFKMFCDWRLLTLYQQNLVGNVSGLALYMVTSIKQSWSELHFCFLEAIFKFLQEFPAFWPLVIHLELLENRERFADFFHN